MLDKHSSICIGLVLQCFIKKVSKNVSIIDFIQLIKNIKDQSHFSSPKTNTGTQDLLFLRRFYRLGKSWLAVKLHT